MARERLIRDIFEDDDDEMGLRPRWIRERFDRSDEMDDKDFETRFRLSKPAALYVLEQIEERLEFPSDRNYAISPINQLPCTPQFYATGCFQLTAADLGGFGKTSAHRIIHRVSDAIARLAPQEIVFPETVAEIRDTQTKFYDIARFPRIVDALDCTHVKLQSPGGENGELFRNRKGYFSLNVQAICNANSEFTDVVARWPGGTHDSTIFNACYRNALFEQGRYNDAVLMGDSGYACKSYIFTPLDQAVSLQEQLYNESQIRTRNPIERTFGVWKRRFPAMTLGLRVSLEKTFPIVVATAVLHNILRRRGEELPPDDNLLLLHAPWEDILAEGDIPPGTLREIRAAPANLRKRRELIETYFRGLAIRQMRLAESRNQ